MKITKGDLINEEYIYLASYTEKASHFRGRLIDAIDFCRDETS